MTSDRGMSWSTLRRLATKRGFALVSPHASDRRRIDGPSGSAADDGEAREHQDKGKPNMRQGEDGPIGDTLSELARLAAMIGHQDRLAVPRHHRMHGAEQDGGRHGDEHRAHVSTGNVAKTAGHSVVEPALDRDEAIHTLALAARDRDLL